MKSDVHTVAAEERTTPYLTGKIALVTGASRGLGLAIAQTLSRHGCAVLLNYATDERAAEEAQRRLAGAVAPVQRIRADVGRPEEVDRLFSEIATGYGRLDILVHNAAAFHPMPSGTPDGAACETDRLVAVGPLLFGAQRLGTLMTAGSGRIIAISSSGGRFVVPGYLGLGMAKAALETLVRYLAVEFAGRGVTVNAVAAGKLAKGESPDGSGAAMRVAARTPTGRLTGVEEVADTVALLCRPEAGAIHGQVITIDGGLGLLA